MYCTSCGHRTFLKHFHQTPLIYYYPPIIEGGGSWPFWLCINTSRFVDRIASLNYKGVCRTAPATPCLFKILVEEAVIYFTIEQFYCLWAFRTWEAKPFLFRTLLQTGQAALRLAADLSGSGSVSSSGAPWILRDLVLALSSKSERWKGGDDGDNCIHNNNI